MPSRRKDATRSGETPSASKVTVTEPVSLSAHDSLQRGWGRVAEVHGRRQSSSSNGTRTLRRMSRKTYKHQRHLLELNCIAVLRQTGLSVGLAFALRLLCALELAYSSERLGRVDVSDRARCRVGERRRGLLPSRGRHTE